MLILPFLFYLFSVRYSSFPLIPGLPDSFPSSFQSPTPCNRLSINILAGSLLGSSLGVALKHFSTNLLSSCSNIIIVFLVELVSTSKNGIPGRNIINTISLLLFTVKLIRGTTKMKTALTPKIMINKNQPKLPNITCSPCSPLSFH